MNKTIYIEGEGCDRRLLEKSKIIQYLEKNNYKFTCRPSRADYLLLFTCAFKQDEEDYSSARVRALQNYRGRLLIYGCLPDIAPHRLEVLVALHKLAPKDLDRIDEFFEGIEVRYAEVANPHGILNSPKAAFFQKVRRQLFNRHFIGNRLVHVRDLFAGTNNHYYLMVSRGCLGKCSYCAIRRAVGSVKSKPIPAIVAEFREGLQARFQDYVLLGDDLGSYGLDGPGTLPLLIKSLNEEIKSFRNITKEAALEGPGVRLHLKEVHPKYLLRYEEYLPKLLEDQNIKSLLCPIQSGSPRILELMQREHTVDDLRRTIGKIRRFGPGIELSTQIIVGFPTESEEDFETTLSLVGELGFRWVVVFPYDRKPNTPAASLEGQAPPRVIQSRVKKALRYFRHHGIKALTNCPW